MTEMDMKRLGAVERKILRKICAPAAVQGIWRNLTNQEMREQYIKKKRLECTGPKVRMDQGRTVKKIFENKQEGSKRRGRQM
jgi:hypothetical protein